MIFTLNRLFKTAWAIMTVLVLLSGPVTSQTGTATIFDFTAWENTASRAEGIITDAQASSPALETLRARLSRFRSHALALQDANRARITTLQSQLDALGPTPAEGVAEAAEVAQRRSDLTAQLSEVRAPVLAAQEAYRRADGMIGELDGIIRARITNQFLTLGISPLNPVRWPDTVVAVSGFFADVVNEVRGGLTREAQRAMTRQRLPLSLVFLALGVLLMVRGRQFALRAFGIVPQSGREAENEARALLLSTSGFALPIAGVWLIVQAATQTGLVGLRGDILLSAILWASFYIFGARWLGSILFSQDEAAPLFIAMAPEAKGACMRLSWLMGVALALYSLVSSLANQSDFPQAASVVLAFPIILGTGFLLIRMGVLLDPKRNEALGDSAGNPLQQRTYQLVTRGIIVLGVASPLLASIGYYSAATALAFPAVKSLALFGTAQIIFRFLSDLFDRLSAGKGDAQSAKITEGGFALLPVFLGFVLICVSLPVLALIWGARVSDLLEIWARINDGISLGGRHISIGDFMLFAIVFASGYTATRLIQSGLKNSVLPRTKLDAGGRNAILTGTGYTGIFLSALGAITAAGLDLSGIALVAGALSVGIGFGLQAIVSNFVSGVILLVERPIKEGDWISVGSYEGTVRKISVRATEIQTFDRATVVIPNADFISGSVINYTHNGLNGRVKVPVGVSYDSDPDEVRAILMDIADSHELVDKRHSTSVVFMGFGADSLNFEIRAILKDVNNILSVRSDMNYEILQRFRAAGIEIPFAQRDVNLRNVDELGAAIGKATKAKN